MSNDFRRINRYPDGRVEQKHLYVTYDAYCQCNCQCCRNKCFNEEAMQGKRYLLDEALLQNFGQFRHIVFGGGEPLYKIGKIVDLLKKIRPYFAVPQRLTCPKESPPYGDMGYLHVCEGWFPLQ